jgi:Na+/H+ antiporter NhaD/arsenite permease-like protein|tara:strand:+ start:324 stop:2063 length:1740 start_codon:yes stop_codon:yes gene_type:complete
MVAGISLTGRLNRHPAQNVAMLLILVVGTLMFASEVFAQGTLTDTHLELNVKEGLENQAIWFGLGILLFVYALIITEVVHRTLAACIGGLLAVLALNYFIQEPTLTLRAVTTLIDWETIGLLLGMMVMVGILSHTGVFEWFAVEAYKKSKGSIWTLVVILCSVTAVLSAFLDNVTTMLLITPVTIQLAKVLDLKPIPILISEVLFSNVGGAATMIGDPPNIMIGSGLSPAAIAGSKYPELASSGVTFNDFITEMAPGILMTIVPTFMLVKYLYRDEFSGERHRDIAELEAKYGVKDAKLLKISGFILGLVILGFFLHPIINVAVSWVALAGAVLMLLATNRHDIEEPLEKVEWTTLLFFAGLFVLVHSLQYLGVINFIGNYIEVAIKLFPVGEDGLVRLSAAILIVLWVSAFASAFIDNIPYTVTMIPIVLQISSSLSIELGPLIWALAFGACLGGNGTLIGASANVVTAGMAEEAGYPISFKEFFRAGFPVMILTTAIISVYMIAVYVFSADHTLYAKVVLLGITSLGIILQVSRGISKGKSFSEALIDDEYDEIKEVVSGTINTVKSTIMSKISEEE